MESEFNHIKELLETHVEYMNRRMDETRSAVMDATQMVGDHEARISVMEKRESRSTKWGAIGGVVGGFISGLFSGKIG